ncbi:MAG: hypothetical protein SF029_19655 [bacterium]|nr:hypothetical protein [bacterium]
MLDRTSLEDGEHDLASVVLHVMRQRGCALAAVDVFATQPVRGVNLIAFYQPHHTRSGKRKREVCYLITSLTLSLNCVAWGGAGAPNPSAAISSRRGGV